MPLTGCADLSANYARGCGVNREVLRCRDVDGEWANEHGVVLPERENHGSGVPGAWRRAGRGADVWPRLPKRSFITTDLVNRTFVASPGGCRKTDPPVSPVLRRRRADTPGVPTESEPSEEL